MTDDSKKITKSELAWEMAQRHDDILFRGDGDSPSLTTRVKVLEEAVKEIKKVGEKGALYAKTIAAGVIVSIIIDVLKSVWG